MKGMLFAALLVASCAGAARGTTEVPYLVSQPIESDAGVTAGVNTYLENGAGVGIALLLTAAENRVSTQGGFRDMNAAARLGIKIRMLPDAARESMQSGYWWPLYGDTLRVVLDVTSVTAPAGVNVVQAWNRTVVETTIQCMTENAAREPRARYLDVHVEGPAEYQDLAGPRPLPAPSGASADSLGADE